MLHIPVLFLYLGFIKFHVFHGVWNTVLDDTSERNKYVHKVYIYLLYHFDLHLYNILLI